MSEDQAERLARLGFGARAALYGLIALLAGRTAAGLPGEAGAQGAFQALAGLPTGRVALGALSLGLGAYAAWSLVRAIRGPDRMEWRDRGKLAWWAVVYGGLAVIAARQVLGGGGSGQTASLTRELLAVPAGRVTVGVVGLGLVVAGAWRGWQAGNEDLREALAGHRAAVPGWVRQMGRVGYAARAVTFLLVGGFVVHGAITADSSEVQGLDVALDQIARSLPGRVVVGAVAAGLACLAAWFASIARHGLGAQR